MTKDAVDVERFVRRHLLRPLESKTTKGRATYADAMAALDERAKGEAAFDTIRPLIEGGIQTLGDSPEERAHREIAITKALYAARRISIEEYVMFASWPVENVHDQRWTAGAYNPQIGDLKLELRAVEIAHGLESNQYWLRGEGPEDYEELNKQYDLIHRQTYLECLIEFGLGDLATMQPDRYDRLRERGRRSIFHREETVPLLKDVLAQFEQEAQRAAEVEAFTLATIGLASAIEALLVLRCLHSPKKATIYAKRIAKPPRHPNDPRSWNLETLIEVCRSTGWLPKIETSLAIYDTGGLSHLIRTIRNMIHPTRKVREKPWVKIDRRDYDDVKAAYEIVRLSLLPSARRHK